MNSSLLTWCDIHLNHLKDRTHNAKKRSGELSSRLFETYKNSVRPHGCHIYNSAADMAMSTMCPCPSKHHGPPQWKFLLRCCERFPSISMQKKCVQQFVFMFTKMYHILLFIEYAHMKNEQYVLYVPLILVL